MGTAPINSRLNVVVWSPTPFGLGRNGCWPCRGSQVPRALPFIFLLCWSLNDRRRAAHSFFKIGRLFSLFLFSCPSLALLHLLILILLLMSGNPGPIFPVNLICIQESNLNSSSSLRVPGLSALRSDRTHSRSGILSSDTTHASSGVVSCVRQGLSFPELSTSTLSSLDPYSRLCRDQHLS